MRNLWNWAREVEWLAVLAVVLLVLAIAVGSLAVLAVAWTPLALVLGLAGVGLAFLSR